MKVQLREVEFQGALGEVKNLGTLRESLETGDKIRFGQANFARTDKALVMFVLEKGAEKEKLLNIGKELSAQIRTLVTVKKVKAEKVLQSLLPFPIIENSKGTFLGRKGQRLEGLEITEEVATIDWEELVAF